MKALATQTPLNKLIAARVKNIATVATKKYRESFPPRVDQREEKFVTTQKIRPIKEITIHMTIPIAVSSPPPKDARSHHGPRELSDTPQYPNRKVNAIKGPAIKITAINSLDNL